MPVSTRRWSEVLVLGNIWMPAHIVCAQVIQLSDYDLRNIEELGGFTRDNVEHWLCLNAGDFSNIIDFHADKNGEVVIDWAKGEESEILFSDTMYPMEDD